ncbi:MAG: PQQ-dependent sugar dehydrogenase [Flavobacteriaceae bacterium]|nr:PQQ-dependent sugar dehydrogenase [Flavobacteriaceae bacterium]
MKPQYLSFVFLILATFSTCAQQQESKIKAQPPTTPKYALQQVVSGIEIPWGMAFLPDGAMLVTEKKGKLLHIKNGKKTEIKGLPKIENIGQGGLLDIVLHPHYKSNRWIYFTYVSKGSIQKGVNTTLMRAKFRDMKLSHQEVLYKAMPNSPKAYHFGSRILFDKKGYLYFSIGDRGDRDKNPQDLSKDGGKIYRLHADGRIPEDNPFRHDSDTKDAIYSYGHRNPQGLCLHPQTGKIWSHEHGPRGGDEINIIKKGKNYGWPRITYGINYSGTIITEHVSMPGMEQPLFYWTPSIAPSGMTFVSSSKYPDWKNDLLVGSLAFKYLERLIIKDNQVIARQKLFEHKGRLRNVVQAPDGYVYVAIEQEGIFKIVKK